MKKSLIAMALVCGAVVFVAACGDKKKNENPCTACTVKVQKDTQKLPSAVYTSSCQETKPTGNVVGADAENASTKGGHYICE